MSNLQSNLVCITRVAGADLTNAQYLAVKLNSTGQVVLAGAGEKALGILQNNPGAGQAATVAVGGVSKMRAGGVIAPFASVTPNADGEAITATPGAVKTDDAGAALDDVLGSFVLGDALLEANSADGDIISVLITKAGIV